MAEKGMGGNTATGRPGSGAWALILGSSSGFGEATALALARTGYNIFGVHLDRRATLVHVEEIIGGIRAAGSEVAFFNVNAADPEKRQEVITRMREIVADRPGSVQVLLHSLAFGALKSFVGSDDTVQQPQLEMTLDVMANSLVYWVQELVSCRLMAQGGRIFAMTSSGDSRVMPSYGAVSAAKCALESHIRQLAMELAPQGITANAIRAGVTDTPALRKIPGNEDLIASALARNPHRRLTTPDDVAAAITVLCRPETYWMTGNVIGVDGGEDIAG